MICYHCFCIINSTHTLISATMFESKKEERTEKERKKPLKHRFHFIYVFDEFDVGKEGEFIVVANELGKVLATRKIHFVYGG